MQKKFIKLLKKLRRRYIERHDLPQPRPLNKEMDPDIISSHIRESLPPPAASKACRSCQASAKAPRQ